MQMIFAFLYRYRYELLEQGKVRSEELTVVPDVYTKNQNLEQEVHRLHEEADKFRLAAMYLAFMSLSSPWK